MANLASMLTQLLSGVAQPLFNTTKAIPLLIWTFDATEETSQTSIQRAPEIVPPHVLPVSGMVPERAGSDGCQKGKSYILVAL